jgi:hypothetical protein
MSACKYGALATPATEAMTSREAAKHLGVSKSAIGDHRRHECSCTDETPVHPATASVLTGKVDRMLTGGGEFIDVQTEQPVTDWTHIFQRFNLDPAEFVIVNDTVRCSTWQQSKALEDGTRDVVNLYSYRAQFTRRNPAALTADDYAAAQSRLRTYTLPRRIPGTGLGEPIAAVLNLADMQLHKPDGDGLRGTLQRLTDGLENFHDYMTRQRAGGRNINELVMVNNGDPFEGIGGNYANQPHTVHTGLREQMNTVLDVWETYSRELFPKFDKGQFVTVHCNHTQFGRQGGAKDSLTGDADTGSAFLAEALQRILRGRDAFDHVSFTIPADQMNVYTEAGGVNMGFNHGHKIPGSGADGFEKWLNGQVRGDASAYAVRVWISAHKHSLQFFDLGSTAVFQCPSCDGGSKWLRDTTGRFSQSGILALLVGNHTMAGWSDPAML